jgi:DivIVA domain-containing protein
VALERSDITKSNFPTARRGYAPDAVDAHLRKIADEVETLKKEAEQAKSDSLASGASERVRKIVEAAEASAREITAQAEVEAKAMRDEAAAEGREHVARVTKATQALADKLAAMDLELSGLVDGLARELGGTPRRGPKEHPPKVEITDDDVANVAVDATPVEEPDAEPEPKPTPVAEPEPEPEPEPAAEPKAAKKKGDETAGARIIALNMALNGSSRGEVEEYLGKEFDLDDPDGLLDEVFARVGS